MQALTKIDISGLDVFCKGKVRDLYDLGDRLLIVASDRISAFDQILPSGIPDKGKILTAISSFWFKKLEHVIKHHMITDQVEQFPQQLRRYGGILSDRSMLVWKAKRIDVECIVRGYLSGSAWREYSEHGRVGGYELPRGLKKDARLDRPLFTPTTKSKDGHDHSISIAEMCRLVGSRPGEYIIARSLSLYREASRFAREMGVTVIDTKFEFGYFRDEIILIDEVLTPDSSRFLVKDEVTSGPMNLDKQFIRDFLVDAGWDRKSPPPVLPEDVVSETRRRYILLLERLTGRRPRWAQ